MHTARKLLNLTGLVCTALAALTSPGDSRLSG